MIREHGNVVCRGETLVAPLIVVFCTLTFMLLLFHEQFLPSRGRGFDRLLTIVLCVLTFMLLWFQDMATIM